MNFTKMHGLGNDFVILDLRNQHIDLTEEFLIRLADRRFGVGCDQIMVITTPANSQYLANLQIFNHDGSEAEACGNGTRCVIGLLGKDLDHGTKIALKTRSGEVVGSCGTNGMVTVDMGPAIVEWQHIPLSQPVNTEAVPLNLAQMHPKGAAIYDGKLPVAVNVGNPHIVFFVCNLDQLDIEVLGPMVENDPLFPERVNVSFACVADDKHIDLRVWERGAGATLACGTGACATLVAAHRLGLVQDSAWVHQAGGNLYIRLINNHIEMSGPAVLTFTGELGNGILAKT